MPVAGFNRPGDGAGGLKIADKLNFVANLNAKNQPATMADSVASLINKITGLGNVGSKRSQSGATTASATTSAFNVLGGGTSNLYPVSVTGLAFKPTVIVYYYISGSYQFMHIYSTSYPFGVLIASQTIGVSSGGSTFSGGFSALIAGGALATSVGSFTIPSSVASASVSWLAIE